MRKILNSFFASFIVFIASVNPVFCQLNASNSVLSTGEWFKIKVGNTGVYKISYEFLQSIGYPTSALPSDELRLYGNSTGLLPFDNSVYRPDDLRECALALFDGGDGIFGTGDYALFYAVGPDTWSYNPVDQSFSHTKHLFEDDAYFFLTRRSGNPKRILTEAQIPDTASVLVDRFPDYAFHEVEKENIAKSGRTLYGEKFDNVDQYSFRFDFNNVLNNQPAIIRTHVACRSEGAPSSVVILKDGVSLDTMRFNAVTSSYVVANDLMRKVNIDAGNSNTISLRLLKGSAGAVAWLDFIEINLWRELKHSGSSMRFRNYNNPINVLYQYTLANAPQDIKVWDVSDPVEPILKSGTWSSGTYLFKALGDKRRDFVSWQGANFPSPNNVGRVANQNLHALSGIDMVIISHPSLESEATRLANMHRADGLTVQVVEPAQVYNEFSSGSIDATAIKDFMKMLYFRNPATDVHHLRYLLLMGDGSYYNRNYSGNTNLIPTHQSYESEGYIESFVSEDYFGFLDPNESERASDNIDIGIGRIPASNIDQARAVVDKIMYYTSSGYAIDTVSPFGDWRNKVLFVADDLSGNPGSVNEYGHIQEADLLAKKLEKEHPNFTTDKIYLDAYKQLSTPGGERYPDAADAFKNKVQQGVLMVNYTGHGGEVGLAHERVLDLNTINTWTNRNALPLFITATCEFSRFDDPDRTSAGEWVLLNPKGGGIGLLSTTRLVFSSPNFVLNNLFYDFALPDSMGNSLRLGDIIKLTKREVSKSSPSFHNHMNFTLLGDPALRLAYPKNKVVATHVNEIPIENFADTLRALDEVSLRGELRDYSGNLQSTFNGLVEVTVYDKPENLQTLGNDNANYKYDFTLMNRIIFKGKASVVNGQFFLRFPIPKDINFSFGNGAVLFYAHDGKTDANGSYRSLTVGGLSSKNVLDVSGPQLSLYMNDQSFKSGDLTDEKPNLLALVFDESGINTTGNGIGHEILAVLDENTENSIVLNDYYRGDLDSYTSGRVWYPLDKLDEGRHSLSVKVWDIYNNSNTARVEFVVAKSTEIKLENLLAYPNPFSQQTTFSFDHNQAQRDMQVQVDIYDSMGKLIRTLSSTIEELDYKSSSLKWDGTTSSGEAINPGIYVYRITLSAQNKESISETGRLVFVK